MTVIEKMTMALSPNAERALGTVAQALTDTPSAPITALDRYEASRRALIRTTTQGEIAQTLVGLGVYKVSEGATLALLASGQRAATKEIDEALIKANVPVPDRIRLKVALDRFSKLPK